MSRTLVVLDAADEVTVFAALREALTADGPAILPHANPASIAGELPTTVDQRVAVVVETSGSTGRPKRVALSADALLASAAAADTALGGPGDWLLTLPLSYIAGLNVLVRSITSGAPLVSTGPGGFDVGEFVAASARLTGQRRYTALVPTQLDRLLASDVAIEALRRFDRILVGGQAMPPALAANAVTLGLRVTRTYGSSETSGGCVYDGMPVGTTEVAIVDGRVELSGPMLAEGYLDDDARTRAAFHHRDGRRWYRTDDTGELSAGALRITGRLDDLIISGGIKVSLAEIETVVRGLPGLADAVVVAAPSAEWGEVPVVVSIAAVPLEPVRAAVAASLGRAAAPAAIQLVREIPLLATGKPDRRALSALLRAAQ